MKAIDELVNNVTVETDNGLQTLPIDDVLISMAKQGDIGMAFNYNNSKDFHMYFYEMGKVYA